ARRASGRARRVAGAAARSTRPTATSARGRAASTTDDGREAEACEREERAAPIHQGLRQGLEISLQTLIVIVLHRSSRQSHSSRPCERAVVSGCPKRDEAFDSFFARVSRRRAAKGDARRRSR